MTKGIEALRALRRKAQRCEGCGCETGNLFPMFGKWLCGDCCLKKAVAAAASEGEGS